MIIVKNPPNKTGKILQCEAEGCQKTFYRKPSRLERSKHHFCSVECHNNFQEESDSFISCDYCGKTFKRIKSQQGKVNYCSAECRGKARKERVKLTCKICGKEFEVRKCRSDAKVCSVTCRKKWEKENRPSGKEHPNYIGKIEKECRICGTIFKVFPYRRHRVYCSRKCYWAAMSSEYRGENASGWKGGYEPYYGPNWLEMRRKALERDNHKCQLCGREDGMKGRDLSVHHIKPFREFDDFIEANKLTNLLTLCDSCHHKAEHNSDIIRR